MGVAEAEVEQNLQQLRRLLPDMDASPLKPAQLVRLALDLDGVAQRLLVLRTAFPTANVSSIACRHPQLLLDADVQRLRDSAEEVSERARASERLSRRLRACPHAPAARQGYVATPTLH